jgi:hypothetical protein
VCGGGDERVLCEDGDESFGEGVGGVFGEVAGAAVGVKKDPTAAPWAFWDLMIH